MGEKYFFKQPLQEAVIIKRNSQFTIDVMLNGKEIRCHCPTTTRIGDIDLSGACRLDIKTSNAYESNGKSLYLVETKFEKSGEVLPFTEWYSLRNTVLIDSHSYEATKSLGVDSYGELHNGSLRFDASHDSYALFNLNKQYHSFSASLAPGNDTSSDIKMDITIYCDDNVVFSEQGITRLDPKMAINLDVTDVGVLRVETDAEYDGNYDAYLYIYDDILK